MKNKPTYRQIAAFLLAMLVFQVVVLKEAHFWLSPHHHAQLAHCDDTRPGESHLHTDEYAPIDCSICFFSLAPAALNAQVLAVQVPTYKPLRKVFFYQPKLASRANWHFQHRGPPAIPA